MGSITIPRYEYGHPKNEDYEYDLARQREVDMEQMSDLGKHLFEQAALLNDAARTHISIGRQQIAREIISIIDGEPDNQRAIARLLALCLKEKQ